MTRLSVIALTLAMGLPLALMIGGDAVSSPAPRPAVLGMDRPVYLGGMTVVATPLPVPEQSGK